MVLEKSKRFANYLMVGAFFVFALYSNVRMAVRNYHLRQQIADARTEVQSMQTRNEKLKLILSYYQTPSYQEVEARRRLGLKKPEETVLSVKGLNLDSKELNLLEDSVYQETPTIQPSAPTNIQLWGKYLSGHKK